MDAFYVSVELGRRPELRGLPVVVAGSGPRAVVTTASYEARKFGVFSATPAERARRLCPDAVFLTPDFELYRARSREVMEVLRAQVERVEVMGLDEAYLDLSDLDRHRSAARRVKASVHQATGLTCSIGIGPSKLVAKVASDAEKPDGFVELTREQACERFAQASPGLIPGIGPKSVERLQRAGITTLGGARRDARPAAARALRRRASGPTWPALARFEDERPVVDRAPDEVRVARDDLRLRPARPGGARAGAGAADRRALPDTRRAPSTAGARSASSCASTTSRPSPARAACRRRSTTSRPCSASRASCCAGSIRRRPVRLLGVRVAGLDEAAAAAVGDDQLSLAL